MRSARATGKIREVGSTTQQTTDELVQFQETTRLIIPMTYTYIFLPTVSLIIAYPWYPRNIPSPNITSTTWSNRSSLNPVLSSISPSDSASYSGTTVGSCGCF